MNEFTISISRSYLLKKVKQRLAVIGKRVKDKEGNNRYADITASTSEDEGLWQDLFDHSVAILATSLASYVAMEKVEETIDDDDAETTTTSTTTIKICCHISDRYNIAVKSAFEEACKQFIVTNALIEWWMPLDANQAEFYKSQAVQDIAVLKNNISRKAPVYADYPYSKNLNILGTTAAIKVGETHTITYSIDYGSTDDICIRTMPLGVIRYYRRPQDHQIIITAVKTGTCILQLYSLHDEINVNGKIKIIVSE